MSPDLIDKKGNEKPPSDCSGYDAEIAHEVVVKPVGGVEKAKAGKKTDNEEEYERIGESEEKSGGKVFPIGIGRFGGCR